MPTLTTNYNLNKPNVNDPSDEDIWGGQLNTNMDIIDTQMKANADLAAAGVLLKTANYTQIASDKNKTILFDATSGDLTYTLLAAATAGDGFEITVKKVDNSTNTLTVDPSGSETIDGAATRIVLSQWDALTFRSDGVAWFIKSTNGVDSDTLKRAPGVSKAYGVFTGISSAVKVSGYNFASVSRSSTGVYVVTLSEAMADATYTVMLASERNPTSTETGFIKCSNKTTTTFTIETYGSGTGSNTLFDHSRVEFSVFGELG